MIAFINDELSSSPVEKADWTNVKEAEVWLKRWIQSNLLVKAKFDTKHARQRMLERRGIFLVDLKDCGIWWDGYIQMHRANIIHNDVTEKLECVIKLKANKLGSCILKKNASDSEFSVVTFYPAEHGSVEQYMIEEIEVAKKWGQEKKQKMLERNLQSRRH